MGNYLKQVNIQKPVFEYKKSWKLNMENDSLFSLAIRF